MLITIAIMPSLVDYNILLGHDYIYNIQAMLSSLFRFITFPHEVSIITIDQLSYHDPPPQTSHNITTPSITNMESMHYVSTTPIGVIPTPIECKPIALVPCPHHVDSEVGWSHPPLGEPRSSFSPVKKVAISHHP